MKSVIEGVFLMFFIFFFCVLSVSYLGLLFSLYRTSGSEPVGDSDDKRRKG